MNRGLLAIAFGAVLLACSRTTAGRPGTEADAAGSARAAEEGKVYSTGGVVKSFGPGRKYVNILHDDIPDYMASMTMSFEPKSPDQIAALAEGDRVSFTFRDTPDGRRVLERIAKAP